MSYRRSRANEYRMQDRCRRDSSCSLRPVVLRFVRLSHNRQTQDGMPGQLPNRKGTMQIINRIKAAALRKLCPARWRYADDAMRDISNILEHCQVGREQRIQVVLDRYWQCGKAQNGSGEPPSTSR